MAGIGFEIRKILHRNRLSSTLVAYMYAGLIGSGPLLLSVAAVQVISLFVLAVAPGDATVVQFQVSLTYLIDFSLVTTGGLQLLFTRYVADQLYQNRQEHVLPSYHAVQMAVTAVNGTLGAVLAVTLFADCDGLYRVLMVAGFVILSNLWCGIALLSGIRQYRAIIGLFALGYGSTVLLAYSGFPRLGLNGLIASFVAGHGLLYLGLNGLIQKSFHSDQFVSGRVFQRQFNQPSLALLGFLLYVGNWIDKLLFRYHPATGQPVIGPLHASYLYDFPIFLAYLTILPGMAVFLLRIETDFVEHCSAFYKAINQGATLGQISAHRNQMVRSIRSGLYEVLKIQSLIILLVFAFGAHWMTALGISAEHFSLLRIDAVAASLQLLFLLTVNVLLYLDQRWVVIRLMVAFIVLNFTLTSLTLFFGPQAYGFGLTATSLLLVLLALLELNRKLEWLEFDTYMFQ